MMTNRQRRKLKRALRRLELAVLDERIAEAQLDNARWSVHVAGLDLTATIHEVRIAELEERLR